MQGKIRLGVIFGSRSVEHEVSIITAVQLMKHVDREKYEVVPLYIDKAGRWWTGESAKTLDGFKNQDLYNPAGLTVFNLSPFSDVDHGIDVAIICCHGTLGEDGTVQGFLELAGIPYQGPGVVGSAVAMDKIISKQMMQSAGFSVAPFVWCASDEWQKDAIKIIALIEEKLTYPLYVKPANLGSSVGISKAKDQKGLQEAIEIAAHFDRRIIIEQGLSDVMEINVSVLGFEEYIASVPEQPIASGEILSYADKYEGGGKKTGGMASLKRRIPAPIPGSLTRKLQEVAIDVARASDCSGVIRIDFFVNLETNQIWVGEVNTIPGSMAFYLWQASGLTYTQLIDRLVEIAFERQARTESYTRSIDTPILK